MSLEFLPVETIDSVAPAGVVASSGGVESFSGVPEFEEGEPVGVQVLLPALPKDELHERSDIPENEKPFTESISELVGLVGQSSNNPETYGGVSLDNAVYSDFAGFFAWMTGREPRPFTDEDMKDPRMAKLLEFIKYELEAPTNGHGASLQRLSDIRERVIAKAKELGV